MDNTELRNILKARFAKTDLKKRPGAGNLSSINAYAVIARLNDGFGIAGWKTNVQQTIWDEDASGGVVEVIVMGNLSVRIENEWIDLSDTFGNMEQAYYSTGERAGKPIHSKGDLAKGAVTSLIGKSASFLEVGIDVYKGLQNHNTPDLPKPKIYDIPTNKWEEVKPQIQSLNGVIATVSNGTKEYKAKLTDDQVKDYLAKSEGTYGMNRDSLKRTTN